MKKWLDSPKPLFTVLRVLSAMAAMMGVLLTAELGMAPVITRMRTEGVSAADVLILLAMLSGAVLWLTAWSDFRRMCGRLMQGESAFTPENSRTLRLIGRCTGGIGLLIFLRCAPRLLTAPLLYSLLETIVIPGVFLTVTLAAVILQRLLDHAMALEEAQRDVI
ncbi:MAG: DUF2975 domain-containing protein [Clostridia bacterium]|nr:DUF2975 domain-containing protein [Clostridia bacterium]